MKKKLIYLFFMCLLTHQAAWAQALLKGVVKDQSGETLPGVNVNIKGTTLGTITNQDGKYSLEAPEKQGILVFSFVGMITQEIPYNGKKVINVTLNDDNKGLEEVVVVGFGSQKKESVIGAVQKIKPQELVSPTGQLTTTFGGRVSGVISVQKSGEPGADGASFWIRGVSTFGANSKPLVIMDGVEVTMDDINAMSPEVIEGFSILKDASATALYGARGANGVLVVTTKSGLKGKPRINVRVESSVTSPTKLPGFADGVTYMNTMNEALRTRALDPSAVTPRYSEEKIEATRNKLNPYVFPDVDWYDMIFKNAAFNQNVNMNISGGGNTVRYFINASVRHDEGLFKEYDNNSINTGLSNWRYAFQNNLSANISPTTKVGLKINTVLKDYKRPNVSTAALFGQTMQAPPVEFPAFFPQEEGVDHMMFGNAIGGPLGGSNLYHNPFATFASAQKELFESSVLSIFNIDQDLEFITKGLKIKGIVSFQNWSSHSIVKSYNPNYYQVADYTINPDGGVEYTTELASPIKSTLLNYSTGSGGEKLFNLQSILEYQRTFKSVHNIAATAVYLQRHYISNGQYLPTKNQGLAGRATYNYKNKYFAEFNFGFNGSENFMEGNRYGFFPSYALGYLISNERYWEPLRYIVNLLKIRGSFGYVGNSASSQRFPYLTEVELNKKGYTFGENFDYRLAGPQIKKYGTEDASWETAEKIDIGLELGLFNKISIVADYFSEYRSGIFLQRQSIPYTVGIGASKPWANMGKVSNKGFDLSFDYSDKIGRDLQVSFKATATYAKNKILDRDEPYNTPEYASQIGMPINHFKLLVAGGLLTPEDLTDGVERNGFSNVMEGDIKYMDENNDGVITSLDFKTFDKTSVPQLVYGFGSSFKYKKIDFSLFFQGSAKVHMLMSNIHPFGQDRKSLLTFIADNYWTEENPDPNASYPRLSEYANGNTIQNSTFWLRDASFLRLKQAEIGFTYGKMRAYLSGLNLLTWSKFKLWDPELGGGNGLGYPPVKTMNIGVQLNF